MKDQNLLPVEFSSSSISHLSEIRKWTLLFSVLGSIVIGISIIIVPALIIPSIFSRSPESSLLTVLPMLGLGIIYFFPVYFLLKFSIDSRKAITLSDPKYLENAFRYLKFHYRSIGIIFFIFIIAYAAAGLVYLIRANQ